MPCEPKKAKKKKNLRRLIKILAGFLWLLICKPIHTFELLSMPLFYAFEPMTLGTDDIGSLYLMVVQDGFLLPLSVSPVRTVRISVSYGPGFRPNSAKPTQLRYRLFWENVHSQRSTKGEKAWGPLFLLSFHREMGHGNGASGAALSEGDTQAEGATKPGLGCEMLKGLEMPTAQYLRT